MQKYSLLRPFPGNKTFQSNKGPTSSSGPISNEFATAAFRMGHSLVQSDIQLVDIYGNVTRELPLRFMFDNPSWVSADSFFIDSTIRGLVKQHSQKIDNQITDELRLHLFQYVNVLDIN